MTNDKINARTTVYNPSTVRLRRAHDVYSMKPGEDTPIELFGVATLYQVDKVKKNRESPNDLVTFVQMEASGVYFIHAEVKNMEVRDGILCIEDLTTSRMSFENPEAHLARLLSKRWRNTGDLRNIMGASQ